MYVNYAKKLYSVGWRSKCFVVNIFIYYWSHGSFIRSYVVMIGNVDSERTLFIDSI